MSDLIDRQVALSALWKALYDYEDKTEKQFQESKELDVSDWIQHRIFVQNMNDIDRQTILDLPSAQPELPEWAQKVEEYRKSAPSFVRNQLVWALYQTWKEYDGRLVHQRGKENR